MFSNGTTIAEDNANFFWDDTNKRLGIGTTSPSTKLQVQGSVRLETVNNSIDLVFKQGSATGTNQIIFENYNTTGVLGRISYAQSTNSMQFSTANTERMRITDVGRVGIGTTAPSTTSRLHINVGSIDSIIDGIFSEANAGGNAGWSGIRLSLLNTTANVLGSVRMVRTSGTAQLGMQISSQARDGIMFLTHATSPVETMRLDASGRLGIGTTSPSARLDVRAQGALSTDIAFRVRNSADTANIIQARGNGDVFIGLNSGNITTGGGNTAFGQSTLAVNTSGYNNTTIGFGAMFQNTTGFSNVAIGLQAMYVNTTGSSNTSIGIQSFNNLGSGSGNIALGASSAQKISDGNILTISTNSIFIGRDTRANANSQTNQIVIGDTAIGLGSNTVVIGNDSIITTVLKGQLGLGTNAPVASAKVQIDSTTQGFLPPRMTNAQRLAIASPAVGLCVYCTDAVEGLYINKSTGWTFIG